MRHLQSSYGAEYVYTYNFTSSMIISPITCKFIQFIRPIALPNQRDVAPCRPIRPEEPYVQQDDDGDRGLG